MYALLNMQEKQNKYLIVPHVQGYGREWQHDTACWGSHTKHACIGLRPGVIPFVINE